MDINSLDRSKDKADDAPTNFSPDTEVSKINNTKKYFPSHKKNIIISNYFQIVCKFFTLYLENMTCFIIQ